jgi:CPA1 family monovalent cation:H+ antiporter
LERLSLPRRMSALLQGESLLNDAAGLVLFRFAVAAALTGTFSLTDATLTFSVLTVGGVLLGAAVGFIGVYSLRRLQDSQLAITVTLLLPPGRTGARTRSATNDGRTLPWVKPSLTISPR